MAAKKDTAKSPSSKAQEDFQKKWGKYIVDPKKMAANRFVYRTGSPRIDAALGGGFRGARQSMVWGPPGGGKTTTLLAAARQVQLANGTVYWADQERSLDIAPEHTNSKTLSQEQAATRAWLQINGVDPFAGNFIIVQPFLGEELFQMIEHLIQFVQPELIVVDSVPAILSKREDESEVGGATYGSVANLLAAGFKKINKAHAAGENFKTHVSFINQARANIGATHGGKKAAGGNALPHWVRQIVKVDAVDNSKEEYTESKVQVTKNSFGRRSKDVRVRFSPNRGLDVAWEILQYGIEVGFVKKSGSWYSLFESPEAADAGEAPLHKCQGDESLKEYLSGNNWTDRMYHDAVSFYTKDVLQEDSLDDSDGTADEGEEL